MSVDIKREIRAYAAYLDEILPTVTADDVRTATVPTPLGPSRTNRSDHRGIGRLSRPSLPPSWW
jgi:hypothetical protein